jgi:adenine phosphoribosyltransferase
MSVTASIKPPPLPKIAENEVEIFGSKCFFAVLDYQDRLVLIATQRQTFGSLIAAESTILPGGSRAFDIRSLLGRTRGNTTDDDEAGAVTDYRILIARRIIERLALAEDLHEEDESKRIFQGRPILLSVGLNNQAENNLDAIKRIVQELCSLCSSIGIPVLSEQEKGLNNKEQFNTKSGEAELISMSDESRREVVKMFTKHVDFPKKGIQFVNVLPVFSSPRCVQIVIDAMAKSLSTLNASLICGIESRGFLFGTLLSMKLNLPFVCIRKAGKLPGICQSISYDLEYGQATIQVQSESLTPFVGKSAILCDDLLATGGTAKASIALLESCGVTTSCIVVLVELLGLGGAKALEETKVITFCKE